MQDEKVPVWELQVPLMINSLSWKKKSWYNETWVDSGGYQIMKKGTNRDLNDLISVYKTLKADCYMSLDIPTLPCQPPDPRNFENFKALVDSGLNVVPIIHGYCPDAMEKALDFYRQFKPSVIAYGGMVPPSMDRAGGRRIAVILFHYLREMTQGKEKLHVLGVGSPFMRKVYFSADSADTATYRVKAIMGMVLIPGRGERYVGIRTIKWHVRSAIKEELQELLDFLESTHFPYDADLNTWIGRSMINAWVLTHSEYGDSPDAEFSRRVSRLSQEELRELAEEACKKINSRNASLNEFV